MCVCVCVRLSTLPSAFPEVAGGPSDERGGGGRGKRRKGEGGGRRRRSRRRKGGPSSYIESNDRTLRKTLIFTLWSMPPRYGDSFRTT